VERPSLRTVAIGLTVVLVTSATVGTLALAQAESDQDAVRATPNGSPDAGGGWSWIALLSLYLTLLVLGPTIAAWWVLWSRRDDQNRRR
jgi:hypothetical protein